MCVCVAIVIEHCYKERVGLQNAYSPLVRVELCGTNK